MSDFLTETVISTNDIYKGRVIHLSVKEIRLPDGSIGRREIIEHPGAVCIVPVTDAGEVLMVRQFRLASGVNLLEVPAGTLEPDEEPAVCALRELEEETGWTAAKLTPLYEAFLAPGYSTELMYAYMATSLSKPLVAATGDADEFIGIETIPIPDLEKMVLSGQIRDCKSISAIMLALHALRV